MKKSRAFALLPVALLFGITLSACGDDDDSSSGSTSATGITDSDKKQVIETYANIAHTAYSDSLASAKELDTSIDTFLADPNDATQQAAKDAWIAARADYLPTEVFRFYGGPIDNSENGPEGLLNAWPMDEAYVDYVEGNPNAGIINNPETFPEITETLLLSQNEQGGEENISTGYHAIEFLLWGQDLSPDGPGARPASDFTTGPNVERRRSYLDISSDLLLRHLQQVVMEWAPGDDNNYRATFTTKDSDEALRNIFRGMGALSQGELAGERMFVAYESGDQEDEHSCFSDNTKADLIGNAKGIRMIYFGRYANIEGPGITDLVATVNPEFDAGLRRQLDTGVAQLEAIPAPFDQQIIAPVESPGKQAILAAIEMLEAQGDIIVSAAAALGLTINIEI